MGFRTIPLSGPGFGLLLVAATLLLPGCAYLAKQASGHMKLMAGRVPLEEALATVEFTDSEREVLEWVPRIKAFGESEVGLSETKNYTTINPDFDDVVWNVSACAPDRFEAHRYHYPVVGVLPYIGFFDKEEAREEAQRLRELGWETHVRPAGAYSTLGWFRDPLWRSMLKWDLERMANTVLHELAHASLWLKGEGRFNESFASFVGDRATELFLQVPGEGQEARWQEHLGSEADRAQYRASMHLLVVRLEALYAAGLSGDEVARRREAIIQDARESHARKDWKTRGYARAMRPERQFNNARLYQFRVYNTGMNDFDRALARFGGDLRAFVEAARTRLPREKRAGGRDWDPYEALRALAPQ
ncbi:MAG: aminopeptidase [Myxococcota bacterium]|nr:aminopeptidase [Myxococcota bacterium]